MSNTTKVHHMAPFQTMLSNDFLSEARNQAIIEILCENIKKPKLKKQKFLEALGSTSLRYCKNKLLAILKFNHAHLFMYTPSFPCGFFIVFFFFAFVSLPFVVIRSVPNSVRRVSLEKKFEKRNFSIILWREKYWYNWKEGWTDVGKQVADFSQ